ncbi:hypothetical protein BDV18DRAFT_130361 [Aspergillus unguis]
MSNELDTPNIPFSSAVSHTESSISIDAPIQDVWHALTHTSTWPRWNRFVPRVTIREQPRPNSSDNTEYTALQDRTRFIFHVNMHPESSDTPQSQSSNLRATNLHIIQFDPPTSTSAQPTAESSNGEDVKRKARITWASDASADGFPMSYLLTAERVHELREVVTEDGRTVTEVRNWEAQTGYLAYVVKWLFGGRLRNNFQVWVEGLKGFVEGQQ